MRALLLCCCLLPLLSACNPATGRKTPKNIILMISDGCGYNQIAAANLYAHGKAGAQPYQQWPVRYAMCTAAAATGGYNAALTWGDFNHRRKKPTDSAASATAFASGKATYSGSIGKDMDKKTDLPSILERCEVLGRATGVVSSVPLSHATPASFVAHHMSRHAYKEIGRQMIMESACDVIMACGHPLYDDNAQLRKEPAYHYVGGKETWDAVQAGTAGADADGNGTPDPWKFIDTPEQFRKLAAGKTPARVLGIPRVLKTLQQKRTGTDTAATSLPYAAPLNKGVPTLAEMTAAALNVLDDDPDGLFLMVEGGAIDWAGHANQLNRNIEEEIGFNKAVAVVIAWVENNGGWEQNLVIVTGDHETGFLYGPGAGTDTTDLWKPLVNNGKGKLPGAAWYSGHHTNALIPLFANGTGSGLFHRFADEYDPVRGRFVRNTEVGQAMFLLTDD